MHVLYIPIIIDSEVCLKPSSWEMQYLYVNVEIKETVQPLPTCQNIIYIIYIIYIIKQIVPVLDAD